jgi:hypothetical protein
MACFKIDDDYRIKSDKRQWMLQKRSKDDKEGNEVWTSFKYQGTLPAIVRTSYEYFVRQSEAEGILELMNESKRIINHLTKISTPVLEIKER